MFTNASLFPSAAMDFLLAVPRFAHRAGSLAFYSMPEAVDNLAGKLFGNGNIIADATGVRTMNQTITNASGAIAQSTAAALMDGALGEGLTDAGGKTSMSVMASTLQSVGRMKNFGGIFSYLTSRWALTTFAAVSEGCYPCKC